MREREPGAFGKRHREPEIHPGAWPHGMHCGLIGHHLAVRHPHEIAHGAFDARMRLAVPVTADDTGAQRLRIMVNVAA